MFLKYVEAFYSKSIINFIKTKDSRHLESRWCIIDQFGTEKVEVLTYVKIDKTVKEVVESINQNPEHRWETRQLLAVPREKINEFVKKTSDAKKEVGYVVGIEKYFSDVQPGIDSNSKSYWVPVGLANLIAWTRVNPYILD